MCEAPRSTEVSAYDNTDACHHHHYDSINDINYCFIYCPKSDDWCGTPVSNGSHHCVDFCGPSCGTPSPARDRRWLRADSVAVSSTPYERRSRRSAWTEAVKTYQRLRRL